MRHVKTNVKCGGILHISGSNKDNLILLFFCFFFSDAYFKYFYLKYESNTSIIDL